MSRKLVWLVAFDAVLVLLVAHRFVSLEDAWERYEVSLAAHARLGAP